MPWLIGLALQADGWYLRSPIIWAKGLSFCETYSGSVMPESVRDRPTTSYEYLLLLTKSKSYFYDADAVREVTQTGLTRADDCSAWKHAQDSIYGYSKHVFRNNPGGRNLRSVWAINPHPFKEAHFATFPPKLVEPCIKAGTSERGCCPECGKGWERIIGKGAIVPDAPGYKPRGQTVSDDLVNRWSHASATYGPNMHRESHTLGWRPGCSCGQDPIPCIVLDPFVGSGTSVMVALRLGRRAIGIDLSQSYCEMARQRVIDDCPMLNIPGEAK